MTDSQHAFSIGAPRSLKGLLLADFNALNFAGILENHEESPAVEVITGDYGEVLPMLADAQRPEWLAHPDFAWVWTRPEMVAPPFRDALANLPCDPGAVLAAVDSFAQAVAAAAGRVKWLFVPSWQATWPAGVLAAWQPGRGAARLLAQMNLRLAEALADTPNVFVLDSVPWFIAGGKEAFQDKLWFQGKIPFNHAVFQAAARDLKAALQGLTGQARKLVVVDLDDTLWGGIVGEVGWEKLQVGGHDALGEAYADFQRTLKALTRQGILLGIVSKNDETTALTALREHPEMQLRPEDFAGWRINWQDKAQNLAELAAELRLGLQSVVFIDDQPAERARIREALPEVLVPEWPENPMLFSRSLLSLKCFENPRLSEEDRARVAAYEAERRRADLRREVPSVEDWLRRLELQVKVEKLNPANLPRAAQLLNKTNQMNLTTRRLSEAELAAWASVPGHAVWVFRVKDKLGDSGLTGLASLQVQGEQAKIVDFLLSCRVLGRKVEQTMVHWLVQQALAAGAHEVVAEYLPTPKNKLCLEFWQRSGFQTTDGRRFLWNTGLKYPLPDYIQLAAGSGQTTVRPIIEVGQSAELHLAITGETLRRFIALTGDASALHADPEFARRTRYGGLLVHGMCPLLFLSVLDLVQQPGRRAMFRQLKANFNHPIYPDDPLLLRATITEYIREVREVEIEFQIRHRNTGLDLTNGLAAYVLEKTSQDTTLLAAPQGGSPALVTDPLQSPELALEQIPRGMEAGFTFVITDASLLAAYELLAGAVDNMPVDYETWRWRCDTASLLATSLVSTFVGQCIPGRYGTCRNVELTFHQPLEKYQPYRFQGHVNYTSASTSSVITQVAIAPPQAAAGVAWVAGKIHAGVLPSVP
jgi:FkbH-like protein